MQAKTVRSSARASSARPSIAFSKLAARVGWVGNPIALMRVRFAGAGAAARLWRETLNPEARRIYKASGALASAEPGLSPLWQSIKKIDSAGVSSAVSASADLNERDANGDTPLLYIARAGHYKYPPADIPTKLVQGGADIEAKDSKGMTALQVSLLAGWQNIAELLIKSKASTAGVAEIKSRLTCPDCKRIVAKYNL